MNSDLPASKESDAKQAKKTNIKDWDTVRLKDREWRHVVKKPVNMFIFSPPGWDLELTG